MKHLIVFLLLSLSVSSYAQECTYAINKNGILQTNKEVLAYNSDLSGIMVTAMRDGNFKYFELSMFLSKKLAFDRGNTFQLELEDGRIATGSFSEKGSSEFSAAVGYYCLKIKVNFPQDSYGMLSMVPVKKIKMRANSEDVEMLPMKDSSKFMEIVRCIL